MLSPELSPDGRRIAIDRVIQGNRDVWLLDLARGVFTRFTFDAAADGFPLWAPDGSRIAFESTRTGSWDIWLKPSSGMGMEERLLERPVTNGPLTGRRTAGSCSTTRTEGRRARTCGPFP